MRFASAARPTSSSNSAARRRRTAALASAEGDIRGGVEVREQREVLEHHADAPSLGRHPAARAREQLAARIHLAGIRPLEPRDQAQHRRLA
jgi:hypothetical protein